MPPLLTLLKSVSLYGVLFLSVFPRSALAFSPPVGGARLLNPSSTSSRDVVRRAPPPVLLLERRARRTTTGLVMAGGGKSGDSVLPSPLRAVQNAVGASARGLVASCVAAALLVRRDPATFLWVAGGILNAALSKVLKRLINESRPEGARTADPGMPSSHAMSLFFLSVFVAAAAQDWRPQQLAGLSPSLAADHRPVAEAVLLVGYAVTASTWRVGAGYHTREQVAAGAALGTVTGLSWYALCRSFLWSALAPLFPLADDGRRQASLRATVGLLAVGACAVGSVERRVKGWWAKAKAAAAGDEKKGA